jgi:multiple sugar transport system ATP-binding protein
VEVLKKIDIHVAPGEFLILVGPSGCGKSTLLNIIAGLDDPTEGEVRIGGKNVVGMPPPTATLPWCSRATRCTPP